MFIYNRPSEAPLLLRDTGRTGKAWEGAEPRENSSDPALVAFPLHPIWHPHHSGHLVSE